MSLLDVLTQIEPNRIVLKVLFILTGKMRIVQKQLLQKHRAVVDMFGANLGKLQRTQIPSKHGDLKCPWDENFICHLFAFSCRI